MDTGRLLYRYPPLPTKNHIRMLRLQPGGEKTPLHGELEVVELSSAPRYIALSYMWGNVLWRPYRLHIATDAHIPLRESLFDALRDMRLNLGCKEFNGIDAFWVDQICINQDDPDERSQQVAIMREIYSNGSAQVITYIGPASLADEIALELAQRLSVSFVAAGDQSDGHPNPGANDISKALLTLPSATEGCWEALDALLNREWSTRIWIVQESICGNPVWMMCGNMLFDWMLLPRVADLIYNQRRIPEGLTLASSNNQKCLTRYRQLRGAKNSGPSTLLDLLVRCQGFQASEPRDKIYALFGMATDYPDLGIIPDYSRSLPQILADTTFRIMVHTGSLDILSWVDGSACDDAPSWVPDWSDEERVVSHPLLLQKYNASAGESWVPRFTPSSLSLGVHGYCVDLLSYTSEELPITSWDGCETLILASFSLCSVETGKRQDHRRSRHEVLDAVRLVHEGGIKGWMEPHRNTGTNKQPSDNVHLSGARNHLQPSGRRFAITKSGQRCCLVPTTAKIDDMVVVLFGASVPFILRKVYGKGYRVIGEAYVYGLMQGKVLEDPYEMCFYPTPRDFRLV